MPAGAAVEGGFKLVYASVRLNPIVNADEGHSRDGRQTPDYTTISSRKLEETWAGPPTPYPTTPLTFGLSGHNFFYRFYYSIFPEKSLIDVVQVFQQATVTVHKRSDRVATKPVPRAEKKVNSLSTIIRTTLPRVQSLHCPVS